MRTIIIYINNLILPLIPETRGFGLKRFLWRLAGAKIGDNVKFCSSARIYGSGELSIGANTWIGSQVLIVASSSISIGENTDIAPRVYIGTGTHKIDINSMHIASEGVSKDVIIHDGCWICTNAIILPGTVIGEKNIVSAGAVVTQSFLEEKILLAGVPAVKKKKYE